MYALSKKDSAHLLFFSIFQTKSCIFFFFIKSKHESSGNISGCVGRRRREHSTDEMREQWSTSSIAVKTFHPTSWTCGMNSCGSSSFGLKESALRRIGKCVAQHSHHYRCSVKSAIWYITRTRRRHWQICHGTITGRRSARGFCNSAHMTGPTRNPCFFSFLDPEPSKSNDGKMDSI